MEKLLPPAEQQRLRSGRGDKPLPWAAHHVNTDVLTGEIIPKVGIRSHRAKNKRERQNKRKARAAA